MNANVMLEVTVALSTIIAGCNSVRHHNLRRTPASQLDHVRSPNTAALRTIAEARDAVDANGLSEVTMERVCNALGRLAREPGLKEEYSMRTLHGGGATSVVLASEGDDGLTLRLSRFEAGTTTPIHDHGCWAVAYIIDGRDEYTHWKRVDAGQDRDHATLQIEYKRVLNPGDCVHWLDPPHDIHCQHALEETTWELVLFGKNHGRTPRQYFDPETGRIEKRMPQ